MEIEYLKNPASFSWRFTPDKLELLKHTQEFYLYLLRYMPLSVRETIEGQTLLSSLRNDLSDTIGISSQEVQEHFEAQSVMNAKHMTMIDVSRLTNL